MSRTSRKIGVAILLAVFLFVAGVILVAISVASTFVYANRLHAAEVEAIQASHVDELEAEYYRGLFDVCAAQTGRREMCLGAVSKFKAQDWYGQESPGFEWPLPVGPAGVPSPSRGYPQQQAQSD